MEPHRQKTPAYLKLTLQAPAAMADDAAATMIEHGAIGCAVAGRVSPRSGIASRRIVSLEIYFEGPPAAARTRARDALAAVRVLIGQTHHRFAELADPGWATQWQSRFRPLPIGRRLLILPPWWPDEASGKRISILIQPGQAFGTGHHGSTYGMMRALEDMGSLSNFGTALDVGTGSGILSIAMVKLGVEKVLAVDCDAVALGNARENAALNKVGGEIRFATTPARAIKGRFPLVTANILASTLRKLAPVLIRRIMPGGRLILGGILVREAGELLKHYRPPLKLIGSRNHRGWTTLILEK
jgi:ribosomal protein L11 methyltransferase